jgi:hypothetical protein
MSYRYWSPVENPAYAWHQVKIILRNAAVCLVLLASLNLAWLLLAFDVTLGWRRELSSHKPIPKYLGALLMPLLLLGLYLPTSVNLAEQRFFYPAFPFLFAAVALWANEEPDTSGFSRPSSFEKRVWWLTVLGITFPLLATVLLLGNAPKQAGDCAFHLTRRMKSANLSGPIAGSGMLRGGRAGLYVAFLLNEPWYGDERQPTPAGVKASGARLVVVGRRTKLAKEIGKDPGFADCDPRLFATAQERDQFPLQVYEIKGWPVAGSR